ncbi:hypothetical protein OG936_22955 [Streptomyces sp. NBC_00846]|uniref:hypothetical protein n=1 Tax=Streptomyces sp. NBC_00846 TaxID=2975849 RepID=UPI00386872DC|nr:hypothetical protein OG936_22955 [Streptomyces sp. NBC_00846]
MTGVDRDRYIAIENDRITGGVQSFTKSQRSSIQVGGDEDVVVGGSFGGFRQGSGAGLFDQVLPGLSPVEFPVQSGAGDAVRAAGAHLSELGVEDHLGVVGQVVDG